MKQLRIISWNVNGIRAVYKKGNWNWLIKQSPDIFCLQETKAMPEQLPPDLVKPVGYESYFDFPKERKGYSGVAIYTKVKPNKVEYIMGKPTLDKEGRLLALYFDDFVLINVYFPNGGGGPVRLKYKLEFYKEFLKFIDGLKKKKHNIVFCGDINTAHTEIDLARPKENVIHTGFLPIERAWLDEVIAHGYVDTWRNLNPGVKNTYTYWDQKTFARERNVGWRIDYFFVNKEFLNHIADFKVHESVLGSDHCPIELVLKDIAVEPVSNGHLI
ncbi:exodeoxyribonuclease III [Candidatus Parcubacteria bacterium]|nr:exodeoxyribonuclease III [Candidatus Parcubacteria bacterium]